MEYPRIETERLILSELKAADVPLITHYADNKKIADNTLNLPHPYFEEDAVFWINMANTGIRSGTHHIFAIRLKNGEFIGGTGLTIEQTHKRAEIGYWIAEPFWNKGYATEAARALIQYGFEQLKLHKITCSHFAHNPASGRVIEKSGFTKEGELKEHLLKDGVFVDLWIYGIHRKGPVPN